MIQRPDAFKRAKRYLSLGFPQKWIAQQVGVHFNTVGAWAKRLGYAASTGDRNQSRRVSAVLRRIQRMRPSDRRVLWGLLRRLPSAPRLEAQL
jgi:hypothetical protein